MASWRGPIVTQKLDTQRGQLITKDCIHSDLEETVMSLWDTWEWSEFEIVIFEFQAFIYLPLKYNSIILNIQYVWFPNAHF